MDDFTNKKDGPQAEPKAYKVLTDEGDMINRVSEMDFSRSYSYADYFRWRFDERLELIKGKIFRVSPAPSSSHQRICGRVYVKFCHYLASKTCEAFIAPFDVRLPAGSTADEDIFTVVQPDICVVCDPAKVDERGCLGPPDLVIEVLSPGNNRKELIDKFKVYEEAGVKEYWIINPEKRLVIVYTINEKGNYQEINSGPGMSDNLSKLFPDFKMSMEDLFAALY